MMFTIISFFQKFAVILFFTIFMATIGSFAVFITLADCIGPARPTFLMDLIIVKVKSCCCKCKHAADMDTTVESSTEGARAPLYADLASSKQFTEKNGAGPGRYIVMEGRRESLYCDLAGSKQSTESDGAGQSSIVEGRRESLYADLESMKQSSASILDGRRASLYSDLESM
jgi:hypothetical protein